MEGKSCERRAASGDSGSLSVPELSMLSSGKTVAGGRRQGVAHGKLGAEGWATARVPAAMAAEMAVRAVRAAKRAECCARACKGHDGLWAHLYPWCARRRAARIVPVRLLIVGVVGLIA
jgi:hypothetical protein